MGAPAAFRKPVQSLTISWHRSVSSCPGWASPGAARCCPWFQGAEPGACLCGLPAQGTAESSQVALSLLFCRLGSPGVLSLSSHVMPSSPSASFVAVLWMLSRILASFLYFGARNCMQYSRWGRTSAKYSKWVPSLNQLAVLYLMHPDMWFALLAVRAHIVRASHVELAVSSTLSSLCAELLSSPPVLHKDRSLLRPRGRTHHFPLLNLMLLPIAQCCLDPVQCLGSLREVHSTLQFSIGRRLAEYAFYSRSLIKRCFRKQAFW